MFHTWQVDPCWRQVEALRKEIRQLEMKQRAEPKPQKPQRNEQRATSNVQTRHGVKKPPSAFCCRFFLVQFVCHLFRFEFSECSCLVFRRRDVCQLRARQKRTHFCIFLQEWQQGNRLLISPCFEVVWLRPMLANAFAFSRVLELRSVE